MGQFISPQRVKEEASLHNFITQQPQKCLPIPPKLRPRKRRSLIPLRKRPPPRLQRRSPRQQPRPRRVRVRLLQQKSRRRRKSQQRQRPPPHPRHKVAWQLSSRRLFFKSETNHKPRHPIIILCVPQRGSQIILLVRYNTKFFFLTCLHDMSYFLYRNCSLYFVDMNCLFIEFFIEKNPCKSFYSDVRIKLY